MWLCAKKLSTPIMPIIDVDSHDNMSITASSHTQSIPADTPDDTASIAERVFCIVLPCSSLDAYDDYMRCSGTLLMFSCYVYRHARTMSMVE